MKSIDIDLYNVKRRAVNPTQNKRPIQAKTKRDTAAMAKKSKTKETTKIE